MPKQIQAPSEPTFNDAISVPDYGEPASSAVIEAAYQALLNNTAWLREAITGALSGQGAHAEATGNVHGAVSAATPHEIVRRDAAGRARFAAPENDSDAARLADINGLASAMNGALGGKANTGHSHAWNDISGKPNAFTPASHSHSWDSIGSKPTAFPPATHSHGWTALPTSSSDGTQSVAGGGAYELPVGLWHLSINPSTLLVGVRMASGFQTLQQNPGGTSGYQVLVTAVGQVRVTNISSTAASFNWRRHS